MSINTPSARTQRRRPHPKTQVVAKARAALQDLMRAGFSPSALVDDTTNVKSALERFAATDPEQRPNTTALAQFIDGRGVKKLRSLSPPQLGEGLSQLAVRARGPVLRDAKATALSARAQINIIKSAFAHSDVDGAAAQLRALLSHQPEAARLRTLAAMPPELSAAMLTRGVVPDGVARMTAQRDAAVNFARRAFDTALPPAERIALLDEALALWPHLWEAHELRGSLLFDGARAAADRGSHALADALEQKAATAFKDAAFVLDSRSEAWCGGVTVAIQPMADAVRNANAARTWANHVYTKLHASELLIDEIPQLQQHARRAAALAPADPWAIRVAAEALSAYHNDRGHLEAWQLLEAALPRMPNSAARAEILKQLGANAVQRRALPEAEHRALQLDALDPVRATWVREFIAIDADDLASKRERLPTASPESTASMLKRLAAFADPAAWRALSDGVDALKVQAQDAALAPLVRQSAIHSLVEVLAALGQFDAALSHAAPLGTYKLKDLRYQHATWDMSVDALADGVVTARAAGDDALARIRMDRLALIAPARAAELTAPRA